MRSIPVALGGRSYDVHVGAAILAEAASLVPPTPGAERVVILSDARVDPLWGEPLERALAGRGEVHRVVVPPGETSKSLQAAGEVLGEMARRKVRRDDLLVALGGGMVGDLAGFVASVYQRGIPVVQVPTTLLAQVDAAVGGKTAVNLPEGKNLVGSFHQPRAVVADVATLATLAGREYRSGLAEVVKYGLCFDPDLLDLVEGEAERLAERDPAVLEEVVARSVAIKAGVVAEDEHDRTDRRVMLNYGHTLAHALEAAGGYEAWLHGEAVAVGMVFASRLAADAGMLSEEDAARHERVLGRLGLPTAPAGVDPEEAMRLWSMDKKYRGGQRWVLLKSIGEPVVTSEVDGETLGRAVAALFRS